MIDLMSPVDEVTRALRSQIYSHAVSNAEKWRYYDGRAGVKNIGIAVPESLRNVEAVVGWPETIVDALEERLDWEGWVSHGADISELERVYRENQLGMEVSKAILDSLVTGVGFLAVSAGGDGERDVIVNAVPSDQATFLWDHRRNRVAAGLVSRQDEHGHLLETLYYPDRTIVLEDNEVVADTVHNRGRAGLIVLPNRSRAGAARGRSEINSTIRYYTDHGIRTILGMEYNREFYTTPQRALLNVEPEALGLDEDSSEADALMAGWKVSMNRGLIIPPNEGGHEPKISEFNPADPKPYIDELQMISSMVAAHAGIPINYMGFSSVNPPSADSIRAMESRLVKKAERRQAIFGQVLVDDLARVCLSILDGGAPVDVISTISAKWRSAATPTQAAATDAAGKLIAAGIAPPRSRMVMDMIGLSPEGQKMLNEDWAKDSSRMVAEIVRERSKSAGSVTGDNPVVDGLQGAKEAE